jgi:hypothetical protein
MSNTATQKAQEMRVPYRALKSFGAVFAGMVFIVIFSLGSDILCHATGIYPPWFQPMSTGLWVVATTYRIIYGVAGGYITARLAPDRPMGHALALGVIGLVLSIAGTVSTWNRGPEFGPRWYPIGLVVTALPCTWLGGKLFITQLRRRG